MLWSLLLLAGFAELPPIEVDTLKGGSQSGRLAELSETALALEGGMSIPLLEILEVRFPAPAGTNLPKADPAAEMRVALVDGTQIGCSQVTLIEEGIQLETLRLGTVTVPVKSVSNVRFGPLEPKLAETWNGLLEKEVKSDLLVVRKGEVLDYLSGVIGAFDDKTVKFLFDKDEISVKREKVFGIIYRRPAFEGTPVCLIGADGGDRLQVKQVSWNGEAFAAALVSGTKITLPAAQVRSLDFSLGKVRFLSQMEPRKVKYVPYFDVEWKYRTDRSLDGHAIRLGNKSYARGLAIHSQTLLRYHLGQEYRRFQATMGIDQEVAPLGDVQVTINGDGKPLLKADVNGMDKPRPVDLDVTGVRELEILVDFGNYQDIGDHLDLADAKVLK